MIYKCVVTLYSSQKILKNLKNQTPQKKCCKVTELKILMLRFLGSLVQLYSLLPLISMVQIFFHKTVS